MIDEINKIGEINSVNDFFDFKLSIKTMIILFIIWCFLAIIFTIFLFGGLDNTVEYILRLMEITKKKIILNKDTKTEKNKDEKDSEKTE